MIARILSIVTWLVAVRVLAFARLPNNKGGDWEEEILVALEERVKQRQRGQIAQSPEKGSDLSLADRVVCIVKDTINSIRQRYG